jgi:hypothetical protein
MVDKVNEVLAVRLVPKVNKETQVETETMLT